MELKFRFLTMDDLPAIKELSDSMGMWNSPKIGENAERIINDPMCDLYGAFTKEGKLIGVGGIRMLTKDYAWIEDVRIHGEYQKLGVGTKIFIHGEELARERNCKIVGYQTVTENVGSCRIGEKLGYIRGHEMTSFFIQEEETQFQLKNEVKFKPIPTKEAFALMKKIPNGPIEEICIGWEYRPLVAEIFDYNPDMKFFTLDNTLLFEVNERDPKTGEIVFTKAIIYGEEKNVLSLLKEFRIRNNNIKLICCLVPEILTPIIEKTDFKYGTVWTGEKNIVVLFKKTL